VARLSRAAEVPGARITTPTQAKSDPEAQRAKSVAQILKPEAAIKINRQLVEQLPQPIDHCLSFEDPREFSYPEPAANRGEGLLIKLLAAPLGSGRIGSRDCCQII
jgi:hypothetical protein